MINPQWLELPISRTIFYGPKDVRAIEVRLYDVVLQLIRELQFLGPTNVSTTTVRIASPVPCPANIPSGQILTFCHRSIGSTCGFVCDTGCYPTVTSLTCGGSGTWTNEDTACNCFGKYDICVHTVYASVKQFISAG